MTAFTILTKMKLLLSCALLFCTPAFAELSSSFKVESAFSPNAGAEELVLKVISGAQKSIRLAAYSFTSPKIVRALLEAHKRGVDVRIVVDDSNAKTKSGQAALNLVVTAGISTRINGKYAIHHDKYVIADGRHLQTGSFNYSQAAAKSNSENVLVVWHRPTLAKTYLQHWQDRFNGGQDYTTAY